MQCLRARVWAGYLDASLLQEHRDTDGYSDDDDSSSDWEDGDEADVMDSPKISVHEARQRMYVPHADTDIPSIRISRSMEEQTAASIRTRSHSRAHSEGNMYEHSVTLAPCFSSAQADSQGILERERKPYVVSPGLAFKDPWNRPRVPPPAHQHSGGYISRPISPPAAYDENVGDFAATDAAAALLQRWLLP
ncbi:hypothetical protein LTR95_001168 [Oleoguttula sp. CCFEE 5521]